MDSDSSESGDDSNHQNSEYNEDQITEQKIAMNSESEDDDRNPQNGEFNIDEIKELLKCLLKIKNILSKSLKKNTKHKERMLIKKRNRARNTNVYNAQNEIRKICNTFKNIGCAVSNNQAEGPTSNVSFAEAVAGTSKSQIPAVAGTSRTNTEAILGTSRGHNEAIPGISRTHTEAIPGTSRSHTEAIPESYRTHAEAIPGTSRSHAEAIPESYRTHAEAILGTSRGHSEAIPGTSRTHKEVIPEISRNHTEAIPGTSRSHAEAIPGTSRNNTEAMPGTSRSHIQPAVTEKSTNHTTPVVDTPGGNADADGMGTHKSQAPPLAGNCRNHIKAVPVTSRSHNEPILGESRSDTDIIAVNSRRHVKPTDGASRILTVVVSEAPRSTNAVTEAPSSIDAVPGASRGHTEEIAGTSGSPSETAAIEKAYSTISAPETSRSLTEATPGIYRNHTGATDTSFSHTKNSKATRNQSKDISQSNSKSVNSSIPSLATSLFDTVSNNIESPGTSESSTEVVLSNTSTYRTIVAQCETLRREKQPTNINVNTSDDHIREKESTNIHCNETKMNVSKNDQVNSDITDKKRNTETSLKSNQANSNSDDSITRVSWKEKAWSKVVHTRRGNLYLGLVHKWLCCKISQSQLERLNTDSSRLTQTQILDQSSQKAAAYDAIAEPPQGLFPEIPLELLTDEISLGNPRRRKRKRNSPLQITDMDILRNQEGAKNRTARPESTPSRHIEQGIAISSHTKITNTHKDNKSTDGSKRKLTENCALNGRTEDTMKNSTPAKIADAEKSKKAEDVKKRKTLKVIEKPDSTPKSPIEEAISNLSPVRTADNDKENKSVDENKRKTKAKDSTQNAHVERVITNSRLTNNKQAPDAKKKSATRSDNSDSMRNERIQTMSNSTLTKMSDTKKAKEPMNSKKRKVLGADSGSHKNTYSTIDLTLGNDNDEPKASTSAFKKGSPEPAGNDKKNQDTPYLSDDTYFYNPNEEKNQSIKVIQERVPKSENNDQVLKDQQVIDVDEDTCLYLTQEEFTITNSGRKSKDHGKILKDQPVIDLSEDTYSYEVSQQTTSVAIKKSTPNSECDDEQATNRTNRENDRATPLESNKNMNKHRTKLLEEHEIECAENLLAANIEKEQASKDPGSSNTVVVSSFFPAPSNRNNQKSIHKGEQNATHIKQRLQGNSLKNRLDKVIHASKRPHEKSKIDKNKLNPKKIIPEVTITTKTPDASVSTSSTVIEKTIQSSSDKHTSNAPVYEPELSISIRPTPNRPLTNSAIESIVLQAAQIAIPDLSITTSDDRTPTMKTLLAKQNHVRSKRASTGSEPFTKRDETKPGGQQTNPIQMNANMNQNVLLPSDRSEISLHSIIQKIAQSDYGLSDVTKTPKHPTIDSGSAKRNTRTKSREQPTNSFEKKAQSVPHLTFSERSSSTRQQSAQIKRTDPSNFSSTFAESRPGKPKAVTKASKRPSPDSGRFPQPREPHPIQSGKHNQAPASAEWAPVPWTALLSQSRHQHQTSENRMLSSNNFDFATCQPTNPKPVSISQSTSHSAQGSPKLASSPPQVCSAPTVPRKSSNSNRRETTFNNVQSPQIDWYQPAPVNLTPHGNSRNLNSNVTEAHSNRRSSTKNDSHPIQSWHTPVLSGNERPDLIQTVTSSHHSSSPQSSLPHHLRPLIQEQLAYQRIPTSRDPVKEINPPLRPLLIPKNQAALMDNQRAPIANQPTWHIPTRATDI